APQSVTAGDLVTVQVTVSSQRKIKRPLVVVRDNLPRRMAPRGVTPSLPIAPAFDVPIPTQYQFRPMKRGKFEWSGLVVQGTDALGLVTMDREYETPRTSLTVLPALVPVALDLPPSLGWGISEAASGRARGAGVEPRGVREYVSGDSLRYVHWPSSARHGQLLVKEFEAGSNAAAAFVIQRTQGTEIGSGHKTSLEAMCSHAAFLADQFLRQGTRVEFPVIEPPSRSISPRERMSEILDALAGMTIVEGQSIGDDLLTCVGQLPPGSSVFAMLAVADGSLLTAMGRLAARGTQVVALLYDADAFKQKGRVLKVQSAISPAFVDQIRQAGAHPIVVPLEAYPK
ncbi:MAG: DUF58 domain-containing protein, partial [Fimbriimonas ginsengisoli]|nr:DUF58 domain-containing protein [Fimbriimonas ginsengisoli]